MMADAPRQAQQAAPDAPATVDRERTIETLLLAGLDDYFAGRYERAIHAFTRVLFLDRTHPSARAYIERARAALAERQRETDELLHGGLEAFDRGDAERARDLLTSAVTRGAPPELALPLLERLDRLETGPVTFDTPVPSVGESRASLVAAPPLSASRSNRVLLGATALLLLVAAVFAFGVARLDTARDAALPPATPRADGAALPAWPTIRSSDLVMRRARMLNDRGHLHDALRTLETIGIDDPLRSEADRLTADIQRALLADRVPDAGAPRP